MPIFEFICLDCDHEFERFVHKSSDNNAVECPKCHGTRLEEKFSSFASVSSNSGSGAADCAPSGG